MARENVTLDKRPMENIESFGKWLSADREVPRRKVKRKRVVCTYLVVRKNSLPVLYREDKNGTV